MSIFQIQDNGQLAEMAAQPYDSEESLKGLIEAYPKLLAGEQMDTAEPRRWLLISANLPIPAGVQGSDRGFLNHLFIDQDAMPTLVQAGISEFPNFWQLLISQLLDYAAHAVAYWTPEVIRDQFMSYWTSQGQNAEEVLQNFIGGAIDGEPFWRQVTKNLQQGEVRLVFVSDRVSPEFQRVVEFLNSQMDKAEILAVEISQYTSHNIRIIVPKLIGQTPSSLRKSISPRPGNQWDEASFFQEMRTRESSDGLAVSKRILDWAKARKLNVQWGTGRVDGSFDVVLKQEVNSYTLVTARMSKLTNDVKVQVAVPISGTVFFGEAKRKELLQRFPKIQGMRIVEDARSLSGLISSRQIELMVDQILQMLDWVLHELLTSQVNS
jgi:hypothetical protein